jgi:hypothetical protein
MYTVKGAKGQDRATTLRDARKLDLMPSVSGIIKMAAQPGLQYWMQTQVLLAALTLPRIENEPEDKYIARVMDDSKQHARNAAEFGTAIHAAVQGYYEHEALDVDVAVYAMATVEAVTKRWGNQPWTAERSFAHPLGYGGKTDLFAPGIVIDFKTKAFGVEEITKGLAYEEHAMQLAAYREGLEMPTSACVNIFISTTNPGLVHIHEWTEEEVSRGWEMFKTLLHYWQLKNNFGV